MKAPNDRYLTVKWQRGHLYGVDLPSSISWSDGTPAALGDYLNHLADTQSLSDRPSGTVLRIYPSIVAEARYEYMLGRWLVTGIGDEPLTLCLADPDADEEFIRAELYSEHFEYRLRIHR